ncbi:hypothetical protein HanRHA438_Chr04g0176081 [Helianthus annuus]|nr:hypothetical protein HanRHA438_Chr04g0176081 [Helianthus annuus]
MKSVNIFKGQEEKQNRKNKSYLKAANNLLQTGLLGIRLLKSLRSMAFPLFSLFKGLCSTSPRFFGLFKCLYSPGLRLLGFNRNHLSSSLLLAQNSVRCFGIRQLLTNTKQ